MEFIPHIWVYWYIHNLCRSTNPDFLLLPQVGYTGGKKGQQKLDQKEPLWERERDNGRNKYKPAQGTFITLLWAKEPRARIHGFKNWSLSNNVKENKYTYVSLIPLVITKQQKKI